EGAAGDEAAAEPAAPADVERDVVVDDLADDGVVVAVDHGVAIARDRDSAAAVAPLGTGARGVAAGAPGGGGVAGVGDVAALGGPDIAALGAGPAAIAALGSWSGSVAAVASFGVGVAGIDDLRLGIDIGAGKAHHGADQGERAEGKEPTH